MQYEKEIQTLDEQIFSQMRICSFDLQCDEYKLDFVPKQEYQLYKLYKNKQELSSYFTIPGSQKNYLKIYLESSKYQQKIDAIRMNLLGIFTLIELGVVVLSLLFTFYTLSPLRNALHLTEEFIKDILHDFNTPLSTLRLNIASMQQKFQDNKNLKRAQNSIQTLLNLQSNLRSYLESHALQKEEFFLDELIEERVELLSSSFKNITIEQKIPHKILFTNKDAFVRVFDNLLSNALKYNKAQGSVYVTLEDTILTIEDTGKGIKNPRRVFERFYKEQDRGIGIGLHIVKKLCEELGVEISVESEVGVGTRFSLNIENLIQL